MVSEQSLARLPPALLIRTTLFVSVETVETHKSNGMRKLGLGGRADIISYAIFRGWMRNN
jgi:DNA-binding NarL/FixJ family response regulator